MQPLLRKCNKHTKAKENEQKDNSESENATKTKMQQKYIKYTQKNSTKFRNTNENTQGWSLINITCLLLIGHGVQNNNCTVTFVKTCSILSKFISAPCKHPPTPIFAPWTIRLTCALANQEQARDVQQRLPF